MSSITSLYAFKVGCDWNDTHNRTAVWLPRDYLKRSSANVSSLCIDLRMEWKEWEAGVKTTLYFEWEAGVKTTLYFELSVTFLWEMLLTTYLPEEVSTWCVLWSCPMERRWDLLKHFDTRHFIAPIYMMNIPHTLGSRTIAKIHLQQHKFELEVREQSYCETIHDKADH